MNSDEVVYDVLVEVVEKKFKIFYRKKYTGSKYTSKKIVSFYAKIKGENNKVIECSVNEELYNRLVEGMKVKAKIQKSLINNDEFYSIKEIKLIYDAIHHKYGIDNNNQNPILKSCSLIEYK